MQKHHFTIPKLVLESGNTLENVLLTYHISNDFAPQKPIVWVFHGLTASSEVQAWWPGLFSEEGYFSQNQFNVICVNTIGSPYGSTAAKDEHFPLFTVRDVVATQLLLAQELGIAQIHTAIGGSFGGSQALEFAYSFNGNIAHLVLLACGAKETTWGIAAHEAQRMALKADPSFGLPEGGQQGVQAARASAMLTYRTATALHQSQADHQEKIDDFKASSYIRYQGKKFNERFNALSYYYLTKCLDTHNLGRGRGGIEQALSQINIPTLVIGFDTDILVPTHQQKELTRYLPNALYHEITTDYGHDGFLIETTAINEALKGFYAKNGTANKVVNRKVLKFGGKSLADLPALKTIAQILQENNSPMIVVASARGNTTDDLLAAYTAALKGEDFQKQVNDIISFQEKEGINVCFKEEKTTLNNILNAVTTLRVDNTLIQDRILSLGELMSVKALKAWIEQHGLQAAVVDARKVIFTNNNCDIDLARSKAAVLQATANFGTETILLIPGFIGTDAVGNTITLGRNGSNFTASLLAQFIDAPSIENWTDVEGVFSANPKWVPEAKIIPHLSYKEANELANVGTSVLHPKTILPLLEKNIPLFIKSTKHPTARGTRIDASGANKGIKAVSAITDVALVSLESQYFKDAVGIDARIFSTLSQANISVKLITQAATERGIGFVIDAENASRAGQLLEQEFSKELQAGIYSRITINRNVAIVAIVGRHNYALEKAIKTLRRHKIWLHLISNSINGEHISLVVDADKIRTAVKLVHNQVVGVIKTVHLFAIGKGNVGGTLIDQILKTEKSITDQRGLEVKVIGVSDSQRYLLSDAGVDKNWRSALANSSTKSHLPSILNQLKTSGLENVIIADNTGSTTIAEHYPSILKAGFDIVASNKIANSSSLAFYKKIRQYLNRYHRFFGYETNVGAGLPIVDTIKYLHQSADKITKINGVFSGSLSYLMNELSANKLPFTKVLEKARETGLTEPDPRIDLSGLDVARKLIILAREVGLAAELHDVQVSPVLPTEFTNQNNYATFESNATQIDAYFQKKQAELKPNEVYRYVGSCDLQQQTLQVGLKKVLKDSPLGGLQQAAASIEIFTEEYGDQPIVVQGAGAGASVTARGVYSDILKISKQL